MGNEGANLNTLDLFKDLWERRPTAAFAMNIAYANVPVILGRPYLASADLSSTPPTKTLVLGYFFPP
jgi:hypothetical protein